MRGPCQSNRTATEKGSYNGQGSVHHHSYGGYFILRGGKEEENDAEDEKNTRSACRRDDCARVPEQAAFQTLEIGLESGLPDNGEECGHDRAAEGE
jgi:hypothetical protein